MNWKLNDKTGMMEPHETPQREICKALVPATQIPNDWIGMRTVRDGVKILYTRQFYLAMSFSGKWRILGIIKNMSVIEKHLRGPRVNFHDAWLRGTPIDEPKFN